MTMTVDSFVPASDFASSPARFIARAEQGERLVIVKNNKPTAFIIDPATGFRLGELDSIVEDLRLASVALVRSATDSGRRFALDDVLSELGIELDDDEGEGE